MVSIRWSRPRERIIITLGTGEWKKHKQRDARFLHPSLHPFIHPSIGSLPRFGRSVGRSDLGVGERAPNPRQSLLSLLQLHLQTPKTVKNDDGRRGTEPRFAVRCASLGYFFLVTPRVPFGSGGGGASIPPQQTHSSTDTHTHVSHSFHERKAHFFVESGTVNSFFDGDRDATEPQTTRPQQSQPVKIARIETISSSRSRTSRRGRNCHETTSAKIQRL